MLSPAPLISAPHKFKKSARSLISGSLAAPVIMVSPVDKTEAKIIFSVAPTLGKPKSTEAPLTPFVLREISPYSSEIAIPSFERAEICKSMGRGPNSQPPG